jgi:periplasmic copper chaperone A
MYRELVLGAAGVVALVCAASAHVTLERQEASVGAPYKAVLRVPHGCDGTATTALRVRIPEGMIAVKPMPKPGWKIDTVVGKYANTYSYFRDAKLSEGVTEVSFSGGSLPDAYYDEFVLTGFIAGDLEPGKTLYFPVVQECEKGVHRWIEIPAAGKSSRDYPEPAPALKLAPKS